MKEFDPRELWKLQEVNGMVLRDIHGIDVAIGKGFEYKNIKAFIEVYTTEYGVKDFMKKMGFENSEDFTKYYFKEFPDEVDWYDACYWAFNGIYADDLALKEYEEENFLDAEDAKYDRLAGK